METIRYDGITRVLVSGDIHGNFERICQKLSAYYEDTLLIVAGDCGFGFDTFKKHLSVLHGLAKEYLAKGNNHLAFVRGNHDNPDYFEPDTKTGKTPVFAKRFRTVPDYAVIEGAGRHILCVGGAVSIDRRMRKALMEERRLEVTFPFSPAYYWRGEMPRFDSEALREICQNTSIDAVVSHSAPSFCAPWTKDGITDWLRKDSALSEDVARERKTMDEIYDFLRDNAQPLKSWHYGHFHFSTWTEIDGCHFRLLDIEEFDEVKSER